TEHDVESMIERLREQASLYRPETERALEDGDYAVIEITTSAEDVEPETSGGHFRLGEESPMPELHEALRGKKPGQSASFEKAYPEDAQNERLRGKNVRHDVTLKDIRVQEKPELNDEFAKAVGGWDSVEQMRETIAADIRKRRELEVRRAKQSQVGERLLERHDFQVPDTLVDEELGKSMQ